LSAAVTPVTTVTLPASGALYHVAIEVGVDFRAGRGYDRQKK
jgi:hypothetical protein